ncbi:4-hydroxy-3-methylbut-2-enyl diphosphate reductase IspH [Paenarthrobacter ilicis]|uniref:4-hydroxy-3-methylbut-2-enyl diphosphate reductase IspH n=2 Tax=Paenarthrobacter ilicis TaxID=43665 RepID=A0ABX0TFU1_9MICC|nr:4-hydroxy-3-methylbut-2-enyl diphosphate reductase IspH [Paenarthrobacter ilicis]NIJ01354.1 4-hydroxy-3-methylbut-2-enyl diphosphate reductase IspH [Paenarthrobacter ilicis]
MPSNEQNDDFERLHQLISSAEDLKAFLDGMTGFAATTLSRVTGTRIECAVTLRRRKRAMTIAGSSDTAILLDGVEQSIGEGPARTALETGTPTLLEDAATDQQWPKYVKNLSFMGVTSALGVPMALGNDAAAALNFFAMERRTVIDQVCGMIMAQNNCSQDEAFAVLQKASQHRNIKLHSLAEEIVQQRRDAFKDNAREILD